MSASTLVVVGSIAEPHRVLPIGVAREGEWSLVYNRAAILARVNLPFHLKYLEALTVEMVGTREFRRHLGAPETVITSRHPFGIVVSLRDLNQFRGKRFMGARQVAGGVLGTPPPVESVPWVDAASSPRTGRDEWVRLIEIAVRVQMLPITLVQRFFRFTHFPTPELHVIVADSPDEIRNKPATPERFASWREAMDFITMVGQRRVYVRAPWAFPVMRMVRLGHLGDSLISSPFRPRR